jgi:hypothetical protein
LRHQKELFPFPDSNKSQPYQGFSKAVSGDGSKKVGLQELLVGERRRKERDELKYYRDRMSKEKKSPSPIKTSEFAGDTLQGVIPEEVVRAAQSLMYSPQTRRLSQENQT